MSIAIIIICMIYLISHRFIKILNFKSELANCVFDLTSLEIDNTTQEQLNKLHNKLEIGWRYEHLKEVQVLTMLLFFWKPLKAKNFYKNLTFLEKNKTFMDNR